MGNFPFAFVIAVLMLLGAIAADPRKSGEIREMNHSIQDIRGVLR
jgi:hypothetical protein